MYCIIIISQEDEQYDQHYYDPDQQNQQKLNRMIRCENAIDVRRVLTNKQTNVSNIESLPESSPESLRNIHRRRKKKGIRSRIVAILLRRIRGIHVENSRKMHRAARRVSATCRLAGAWRGHPFAARAAFCSPDTHVALRLRQTYRAAATSACRFSPRVAPRLSPRLGGCVRRAPRARHDALDDQCRACDPAREKRALGRSRGGIAQRRDLQPG